MKRLFIIIGILAVIFFGMILYRNTMGKKSNVTIQEIEQIESYLSKIYMWKEITNEALPTFDNINAANDLWFWGVVKKNLEEYEIKYDTIQNKAKELFGQDIQKQFPSEGTEELVYNQELDEYIPTEVDLDTKEDTFLLNNIEKVNNKYIVEIVEYIEDYSSEEAIIVRNTDEEEIGRVNSNEGETQIHEIVKKNIDRFVKKRIYLNQTNMIVEKVEKIN